MAFYGQIPSSFHRNLRLQIPSETLVRCFTSLEAICLAM